jgi:hypothetical protein
MKKPLRMTSFVLIFIGGMIAVKPLFPDQKSDRNIYQLVIGISIFSIGFYKYIIYD